LELLDAARRVGDVPIRFVLWRALQARDLSILDDYIHALEDYVEALSQVCENLGFATRALHRQRKALGRHRQVLDQDVDQFLLEGKHDLAAMAQHRLLTLGRLDATYARLAVEQEKEQKACLDIRLQLEARLSEARRRRDELLDQFRSQSSRCTAQCRPQP